MKKMINFLFVWLTATLLPLVAAAATEIPSITPYSAEYNAQIKGIPLGTATYRLRSLGKDQFEMRSKASLILSNQIEVSQFSWPKKNCQPQPSRYTYERNYLGKQKSYNIDFDTTQNKARWIEKNQEHTFSVPINVQDPLTEQLAARCQVQAGVSPIQLNAVRKDSVAKHTFKRTGEEVLNVPAGRYKTIRVEKQEPNSKKNYRTLLWFAPELNYLLVQLQHTEDNTTYTLQLKNVRSGE